MLPFLVTDSIINNVTLITIRERLIQVKNYYFYEMSLIGKIAICEEGCKLTELHFTRSASELRNVRIEETPVHKEAHRQLTEYLAGQRKVFELPLEPRGTEFQMKVWRVLAKIPFGETRTYGEVAAAVGNPKAARAVGMANNRNPLAIFIPCHRVIGANGALVGFGGGLPVKERLLKLEHEHALS